MLWNQGVWFHHPGSWPTGQKHPLVINYKMQIKMENKTFTVRHACSLDDMKWIWQASIEKGSLVREYDFISYFTIGLTRYFYIGELNGQRISCLAVIKNGESCAFIGFYLVIKAFRGKGYGLKTWKFAFEDGGIGNSYNVQLFSGVNMQSKYEKWGLKPDWILRRFTFTVSQAQKSLSDCQLPSSIAKIIPGSQVNLEKLVEYSVDVMGSSPVCKSMLAAWISIGEESSWVATGDSGEIVGYLIMKKTACFPEDGYRIAPFYSNSADIARSLLKHAVEFAAVKNPASAILFLDIPCNNLEGVHIMDEFGANVCVDLIFMAFKCNPIPFRKIFGAASPEIVM